MLLMKYSKTYQVYSDKGNYKNYTYHLLVASNFQKLYTIIIIIKKISKITKCIFYNIYKTGFQIL